MTTPKQSSRQQHRISDLSDLSHMPDSDLQKIRDKASAIHSKMITDLGMQMNEIRKPTATIRDHKRKEYLTKKMIALKLFMHRNHKEQAKRRWTRDADWVSEDGQNEWSLDYSHDNNAWTATNPNYKPPAPVADEKQIDKEALKYLAPYYPAPKTSKNPAPKKGVQVEPSHDHHQIPVVYNNGPAAPARSGKVKPLSTSKPAISNDIQHSDDADDDNDIDDGEVIMIIGGVALLLALIFMIYTTVQ